MLIRQARQDDCRALAELINIAGEGIPQWLWQQAASGSEDAMSVGAARAAGDSGGFSYTNAHVVELNDGAIAAMLLGYRLADPYDSGDSASAPEVVRPLIELESLAPGTWYINAIATFEDWRGEGLGSQLLALAHELASASGADALSLIVASENRGANRLYQRQGYTVRASRPVVGFPGCRFSGDWLLMCKPVVE